MFIFYVQTRRYRAGEFATRLGFYTRTTGRLDERVLSRLAFITETMIFEESGGGGYF